MKRLLAFIILFGGIAIAQNAANATLFIVNDSKGSGFALRPLTLKVLDGKTELASVKNHQTVRVDIKPGVHGLALKIAGKDITVLNAKPGEVYFLRVSVDQGFAYAATRCVLMKPEEAVYWFPEAQQLIKEPAPPSAAVVTPKPSPQVDVSRPVSPATPIPEVRPAATNVDVNAGLSLGEIARRARANKPTNTSPAQK